MIPKIIHYCWFGGNPLPQEAIRCIDSWKRFLPDFKIIEWNETNFDVNTIAYTTEAYSRKKYAFVSDYARLYVLYHYGGIYFDTDVEIIKPLDDILERGSYIGCEENPPKVLINPGLGMAVEKGNQIIKQLLLEYEKSHFIKENGSINTDTIVLKTTRIFIKNGYLLENRIQCVSNIYVYPKVYFCPDIEARSTGKYDDQTYTAHHYTASWVDEKKKKRNNNIIWKITTRSILFGSGFIKKIVGIENWETFRDKYFKRLYDYIRGV